MVIVKKYGRRYFCVCVQIRPYSFYWRMVVCVDMTEGKANK